MLLFISDLHLSEQANPPAISLPYLLEQLRKMADRAREERVSRLEIVLLGDIFELLKSRQWLRTHLRPWDKPDQQLKTTVLSIFDRVLNANAQFFEGLTTLQRNFPFIEYIYIPGNHDRMMGVESGRLAREALARALPLRMRGGEFPDSLFDHKYGTSARHGHEWDPTNRYTTQGAAIGDAVVIDILVRWPTLVNEALLKAGYSFDISFWDEIDNVRPRSVKAMAEWILTGLKYFRSSDPQTIKYIDDALAETAERFQEVLRQVPFSNSLAGESWLEFLKQVPPWLLRRVSRLQIAQWAGATNPSDVRPWQYVNPDTCPIASDNRSYFISGHTHIPEIQLLASTVKPVVYMNTGTWRRVHGICATQDGHYQFSSWDEACIVLIRAPEEQRMDRPPFEFFRTSRGGHF